MNRRKFLGTVAAAGLLGLGLSTKPVFAEPKNNRPNLIAILIDDMGWKDAGFAGNRFIETPNLDRIAKSGIIFSQAYAAAPNCAPTRACLMTGQYTPRHGVYTVVDDRHSPGLPHHKILATQSKAELDTNAYTIAEALNDHGYATGMVGMWNLGRGRRGPVTPTGQGFDMYIEPKGLNFERDAYHNTKGEYLTDKMTDTGIDFINNNKGKPFFLYMAYHAVHAPFDPKPELLSKYQNKTNGNGDDAAYAATVEALDQNIGRLYKCLKSAKLDRNTYILFTSDNGGANQYVAPLRGGKGTLYEGGIRVPAFAVGPDIKPDQKSDEPISSIDFFPTLLELAGAKAATVDGVSLAPVMTQAKKVFREALYWHFPCYIGQGTPASAIRFGNYKLIEFFETKTVELYDLSKDPSESKDISRRQPELVELIYGKLKKWQAETNAPCPTEANPNYDPTAQRQRGRDQRGKGRNRKGSKR